MLRRIKLNHKVRCDPNFKDKYGGRETLKDEQMEISFEFSQRKGHEITFWKEIIKAR